MAEVTKIASVHPQRAEVRKPQFVPGGGDIDWGKFRVFMSVARTGSFTKAAADLGLQQSTVSRAIENLEGAIGVKLFDRTSAHQRTLTREGELMYNEVRTGAEHFERAIMRARTASTVPQGECKLLMTDGLATHWFTRYFLQDFRRRYPFVNLRLFVTTDHSKSQVPLYDIQIQYAPAADADIKTTRIATFHFLYFASMDYVAAHGLALTPSDISNHPRVEIVASASEQGHWAAYATSDRSVQSVLLTNSGAVALEAILASQCVGVLPSYAYLIDRRLVPLAQGHAAAVGGVYLNFTTDAVSQSATRAVIDYLRGTVFDRSTMPWFREGLEWPRAFWREQFDQRKDDLSNTATTGMTHTCPDSKE